MDGGLFVTRCSQAGLIPDSKLSQRILSRAKDPENDDAVVDDAIVDRM